MKPEDRYLDVGIQIHVRLWKPLSAPGHKQLSFLLVHGLSSNARTWDLVAGQLAQAGHHAAAIDQRGHGQSDKPDSSYDFRVIIQDLHRLIDQLGWDRPLLVGQSWGGNVLLEFAANFPGAARGFVLVDGGFLNLRERAPWKESEIELRPPDLEGLPRNLIADKIRQMHPNWSEEGIEATLGNFQILPDQTIRPWLTLERHMKILKAMYQQDIPALFARVQDPILICAADDGSDRMSFKRRQVQAAADGIQHAEVIWFPDTAHDIHVEQPTRLADSILLFGDRIEDGS